MSGAEHDQRVKVIDIDLVRGHALRFSDDLRKLAIGHQISADLLKAIEGLEAAVGTFAEQLSTLPGQPLIGTTHARTGDIIQSDQFAHGYTVAGNSCVHVVSPKWLKSTEFFLFREDRGSEVRVDEDPSRAKAKYLVVGTDTTGHPSNGHRPPVTVHAVRLDDAGQRTTDEIRFTQTATSPRHIGLVMLLERKASEDVAKP